MLSDFVSVAIVGFFFLQTRRVRQEHPHQLSRAVRAINRAAKAVAHKARQISRVIDVRVRDEHRVYGRGVEWRLLPIAIAQLVRSLEQAAVNEYPRAIRFDQILRSGNSAGRAPE